MRRILLIAIALYVVYHYFYFSAHKQRVGMNISVNNEVSKINFDLQRKCAEDAEKFFESYKARNFPSNPEYKNHYNSSLNKCFILISYGDNRSVKTYELVDIHENKEYASSEKYESQPVPACSFLGVPQDKCDFGKLIKPYMEN